MLCSHGVTGEVTATTDAPSWTTGHDMRTCFEVLGLESGQYPSNSIIDGTSFADESVI